jgi:DNA-binding GntR family transcriptional regulator
MGMNTSARGDGTAKQWPEEAPRVEPELDRLERTTTPDGVYLVLRRAILDGTFPGGGQLRERDIAASLGVSRSPLREALMRLEEEGLILKVPFRGAFVAEVSAEEIAEISSIRLLVEPYAAELALDALRGHGRSRLTQTLAELHRATEIHDIATSIDAHLEFHSLFYELSDHGVLRSLWTGWEAKLRLYFKADHAAYTDIHDIAVEHERLAAVALGGDMEAFRQELARHFRIALGAFGEAGSKPPPAQPAEVGAFAAPPVSPAPERAHLERAESVEEPKIRGRQSTAPSNRTEGGQ